MADTLLITHSGRPHADDVFSAALLLSLFPAAVIVRTRDESFITAHRGRAITFDVGGAYEPFDRLFDHHQPRSPCRPCGMPHSAFGLVWRHYGERFISEITHGLTEAETAAIHAVIDATLVRDVDALDNGYDCEITRRDNAFHVTSVVELLASHAHSAAEQDKVFRSLAESLAGPLLSSLVAKEADRLKAKIAWRKAVSDAPMPGIAVLPRWMQFTTAAEDNDDYTTLYAVYPSDTVGEWCVEALRREGAQFTNRKSLPEAWGGQRGSEFIAASGVQGAVFCHKALFFAVAKGKDAALALAAAAVSN